MKKINKILLVDDSEATNFLNKFLFEELNICKTIETASNGEEALNYINSNINTLPDLIILDIKMPIMDGFDFLDEIKKYQKKIKDTVVIIMLSSSMSPIDQERVKEFDYISDFYSKPLSAEKIKTIIEKHFN